MKQTHMQTAPTLAQRGATLIEVLVAIFLLTVGLLAMAALTVNATNYTDWPASITAADDQEPFRGGYLRTTRTASKPA